MESRAFLRGKGQDHLQSARAAPTERQAMLKRPEGPAVGFNLRSLANNDRIATLSSMGAERVPEAECHIFRLFSFLYRTNTRALARLAALWQDYLTRLTPVTTVPGIISMTVRRTLLEDSACDKGVMRQRGQDLNIEAFLARCEEQDAAAAALRV